MKMKPVFVIPAVRLRLSCCLLIAGALMASCAQAQTEPTIRHFDFGTSTALMPSYTVADDQKFSSERGYGWLQTQNLILRDRATADALRRDFVWGKTSATFRISGLNPGRYKLSVVCGDATYGDHRTQVSVAGAPTMPLIGPEVGEFAMLTATLTCGTFCDINFDSPIANWNVNAISLEPTTENVVPTLSNENGVVPFVWNVPTEDPTKPLLAHFRKTATPRDWSSTKVVRSDYLKLISGEVDFWKTKQDANGAIIDPYRKEEWQYSTPAFAHAAAALVVWDNRPDLLENAAKAMDWASLRLSQRQAATGHEDFYAPMLAHAFKLLRSRVSPERAAQWENNLKSYDPYSTYRTKPGGSNWNVVSSSGEALLQDLGIRSRSNDYVEKSLAAQSVHFGSPYGLYLEGPMAYDHFPRLWLADMLAEGYSGAYHEQVGELVRRASITSLFMQSPWGELPAGGRSAQHQWNEAEQCVTYEIYSARALKEGDVALAGIYKRAAHLSLSSMRRWVRPSGEMQIVKNWVDPSQFHAYEGYSAHSQYNLLPMSMLAIAYERSVTTEGVAERPAPADVGGFTLEIPQLHKVFANAGGTYVEIDTKADHHYDATGLIRIQMKGLSPQLGTSDSVLQNPAYKRPADSAITSNSGVGVSWQDAAGQWRRLGELSADQITNVGVKVVASKPEHVAFDVKYDGNLFGVSSIIEHYIVTPGKVDLTTELAGYKRPLRYVWPVLADDGRTASTIDIVGEIVTVSRKGEKVAQTFDAKNAEGVRVEAERYANHNGWARLGIAEYPRGGRINLVIQSKPTAQ